VIKNDTFPGMLNDTTHARLRRAYYACVSWMDSQLGVVLDALDSSGAAENTWVVVVGDHGWSLGEHGNWAKQQLFENSLRVPMIIAPPRGAVGWRVNVTVDVIVEALDLFPTVLDVLGLADSPLLPTGQLDGRSLAAFLRTKTVTSTSPAAFSQIVRGDRPCQSPESESYPSPQSQDSDPSHSNEIFDEGSLPPCIMGLTVRIQGYRYTAWVHFAYGAATGGTTGPLWDQVVGEELYDHVRSDSHPPDVMDPGLSYDDESENVNVAAEASYGALKVQLLQLLKSGFPHRNH